MPWRMLSQRLRLKMRQEMMLKPWLIPTCLPQEEYMRTCVVTRGCANLAKQSSFLLWRRNKG